MLRGDHGCDGDILEDHIKAAVYLGGLQRRQEDHIQPQVGVIFNIGPQVLQIPLLRPLDEENPDPFYEALEDELLEEINALGIGPQGFGGKTTCLGLAIETAPTHVAGLPVAVNVSCHVTRRATEVL